MLDNKYQRKVIEMVNIIVGKNASGKTRMLLEIYNKSEKKNTICNLNEDRDTTKISVDIERLKSISESIDFTIDHITVVHNTVITAETPEHRYSSKFCEILNLLSKDVDTIIIDDIEQDLNLYEQVLIYKILKFFAYRQSNIDIWITTHSSTICECEKFIFYQTISGCKDLKNVTQKVATELVE